MSFTADQRRRLSSLWDVMLRHRFLRDTRDGTISDERFAVWMRQDYLFVEAAIPFLAALLPRAPRRHWAPLEQAMLGLEKELTLFEERATAAGVTLRPTAPSFVNHAYIQFLMASAYREPYPAAYAVLYTAEKAYHDSWKVVEAGIARDSTWYPFVENWAGNAFADYVRYLETEVNMLHDDAAEDVRTRMAECFELTTKYEIAFWEMAASGEGWPGVDG